MVLWLILAILFASLQVLAVSKNVQRLEYLAKPAVMICLFLWLFANTGLQGHAFWFGAGKPYRAGIHRPWGYTAPNPGPGQIIH